MAHNERQADFWDDLIARSKGTEWEIVPKDIALWGRMGERQARRIIDGSGLMTVDLVKTLIVMAPEPVADALLSFILEGTTRETVDISTDAAGADFDQAFSQALRQMADLADTRRQALQDGEISPEEAQELVTASHDIIRLAAKMAARVSSAGPRTSAPGTRKPAKLRIAEA